MNVQFILPGGLLISIHSDIVPRHGETLELFSINDPAIFQSHDDYLKFDQDYREIKWKINSVHYKLGSSSNLIAIVELTQKEESTAYSAG